MCTVSLRWFILGPIDDFGKGDIFEPGYPWNIADYRVSDLQEQQKQEKFHGMFPVNPSGGSERVY